MTKTVKLMQSRCMSASKEKVFLLLFSLLICMPFAGAVTLAGVFDSFSTSSCILVNPKNTDVSSLNSKFTLKVTGDSDCFFIVDYLPLGSISKLYVSSAEQKAYAIIQYWHDTDSENEYVIVSAKDSSALNYAVQQISSYSSQRELFSKPFLAFSSQGNVVNPTSDDENEVDLGEGAGNTGSNNQTNSSGGSNGNGTNRSGNSGGTGTGGGTSGGGSSGGSGAGSTSGGTGGFFGSFVRNLFGGNSEINVSYENATYENFENNSSDKIEKNTFFERTSLLPPAKFTYEIKLFLKAVLRLTFAQF